MSTNKAMALIAEAHELQKQGARKEKAWASLKGPITERVKRAVQLAPKDPDVLFMATWLLTPFAAAYSDAKRLVGEYQDRLDRLGGPTEGVLEIGGGKEAYDRHRSMVKQAAGSGCLVAVLPMLALVVGVAAIR
jgi:hypothetical protein